MPAFTHYHGPAAVVAKNRAGARAMRNAQDYRSTQGMDFSNLQQAASSPATKESNYSSWELANSLKAGGVPTIASSTAGAGVDQAAGSGGPGGGGSVDPFAGFRADTAANRARLSALYDAYTNAIGAGEAGINTNYGEAATALGNIYGGASQDINAAYDAARAAQTAQLQALGLTQMAPPTNVLAQANTASDYDKLRAAALAQNEAQRLSAVSQNQATQRAAAGEKIASLKSYDKQAADALRKLQQDMANRAAAASASEAAAKAKAAERDWQHQYLYDKLAASAARPALDYATIIQGFIDKGMNTTDAINAAKLYG